ncbi:MAG TPA: hypothetical protein VLV86_21725 [Vicinamibacterales bacterium]|nr:hypothetical protein [Vicinamibacterales bacterium]
MRNLGLAVVLLTFAVPAFAQGGTCDRACLEGTVDRLLDTFVKHDPKLVPVTRAVKYTENGQRLELGDGSWRTMVRKGSYRLFVTDVPAGQVAFIGTMREENQQQQDGAPVLIALRLKIEKRKISEIELLVVRNENAARNCEKLGMPNHVFLEDVPSGERMSRADLVKTANMYFSGMQRNDGKGVYPFADDCDRFENGSQTTNAPTPAGQTRPDPKTASNYSAQWSCREQFESGLLYFVSRIRDRRYVAVDQERGLVFSFAFFDHMGGDTRHFTTPTGRSVTAGPTTPWTWELAEMFKIEDGKIHRIEAVLIQSPYGMGSGWSNAEDALSDRARDVTGVR